MYYTVISSDLSTVALSSTKTIEPHGTFSSKPQTKIRSPLLSEEQTINKICLAASKSLNHTAKETLITFMKKVH